MKKFVLILLLSLASFVAAAMEPMDYRDAAEEQRFRALTLELRCVLCQNQSLADSSAPIAHDLRLEVLRLMREGKSDEQIKQYLVERYTDFVLYKPEVKPMTWLLWFGPGLLIVIGAAVIFVIVRNRSGNAPVAPLPNDNQEW
jgi:cytochrome c-type biogenesis protein CcmH